MAKTIIAGIGEAERRKRVRVRSEVRATFHDNDRRWRSEAEESFKNMFV